MRDNPLARLRVLIVEDDLYIALDIGHILSDAGAEIVGPAHSVTSALTLIDQNVPDIAVLDWQLERETASAIATRLAGLAVPFLFHTSSRADPEAAHPDVTIIDKPSKPEHLVLAVTALTRMA